MDARADEECGERLREHLGVLDDLAECRPKHERQQGEKCAVRGVDAKMTQPSTESDGEHGEDESVGHCVDHVVSRVTSRFPHNRLEIEFVDEIRERVRDSGFVQENSGEEQSQDSSERLDDRLFVVIPLFKRIHHGGASRRLRLSVAARKTRKMEANKP